MIYGTMTKDKAIKDIVNSVYQVLQITKKDLKTIAEQIADDMFGDKTELTAKEFLAARENLKAELMTKGESSDIKDMIALFYVGMIPEVDDVAILNPFDLFK